MRTVRSLATGLLVAVCLGVGCGSAEAPPAPPAAPAVEASVAKVVVLGDSLAAGLGLPADQAFPARVEAALRADGLAVDVVNAGVSGDTSAGGLRRLDWLLDQDPDVLVVELGGNDVLRGLPIADTRANLTAIVERTRAAGVRVVLVGIRAPETHGEEYTAAFDATYPALSEATGVPLVRGFLDGLLAHPEWIQADGLHPTADGHAHLAGVLTPMIADAVRRAIAERSP